MKYTVVCLLLVGCGGITESLEVDSRPIDGLSVVDASTGTDGVVVGSGGSMGATTPGTGGITVDAGLPVDGGGGSVASGSGGAQGTGGLTAQATGGSTGTGGSQPENLACGLALPTCPDTVRSVYFSMVYASPGDVTGSREARICAVNAKGETVADDTGTSNVRCGACATGVVAGQREVYSCLIKAHTVINVYMHTPVTNDVAVYCLPINGVCPDTGVKYTKWGGQEFITGEQ